jgi:hypothetical protein
MQVNKSILDRLGFDLAEAVSSFAAQVKAHRFTVGVPAPTAHPLVAAIVRTGDNFEIVDDTADEGAIPVSRRTFKADIWRRATDGEAERIVSDLAQQPIRKQRLFDDAQFLDHADPFIVELKAGFVQAFGPERADELLAPSE